MTTTLHNGEEMMLVEVPEHAQNFYLSGGDIQLSYNFGARTDDENITIEDREYPYNILGTYHKGEIDFEVREEWVEKYDEYFGVQYKNYLGENRYGLFEDSFLSLLQSLTSPDYLQSITTQETSNVRTVNLAKHDEYVNKKYVVLLIKQ